MSFEPRFTVTNAITADLTRIERARGFLEAATLSEVWLRKLSGRAFVLEAHHTTHIEGTRLSLEESRCIPEHSELRGELGHWRGRVHAAADVRPADPDARVD